MPCEAQHWRGTHIRRMKLCRDFLPICLWFGSTTKNMRKTKADARFCMKLWNFVMKNSQNKFSECWFIQILYTTIAIVKAIPCSCKFWASLSVLPHSLCYVRRARTNNKKIPFFVWQIRSLTPTFPPGVRTVYTERWIPNCCVTNTCHK